jgi:DNA-binding XRE family transcriptional regulator
MDRVPFVFKSLTMNDLDQPPKPKHPGGRPTKRTPEVVEKLAKCIAMGLTDDEAASLVGIHRDTLIEWHKDPEFSDMVKSAKAQRLAQRLNRVESGELGWQGTAWILERCYQGRFSRPELQINQQFNNTVNVNELYSVNAAQLQALLHGKTLELPDNAANE